MARVKPKIESERDKLLREGRIAARKEMTERFYARTPAWRASHERPGNGVSVPRSDQDTRSNG